MEKHVNEVLRLRFEKEIELYKYYMEVSIKGSLFAMGITGALLTYYLNNPKVGVYNISLIIPFILNAGFAILYRGGRIESERMHEQHKETCRELGIKSFDLNPLPSLCRILFVVYTLVSIGLLIVVVTGSSGYLPAND